MTPVETAQILTLISQYNGMPVDKARALAWHDMIGELDYDDAVEAVKAHFRISTDWLQPGHLIAGVKAIIAERRAVCRRAEAIESSWEQRSHAATPNEAYMAARSALRPAVDKSAMDAAWKVKYRGPSKVEGKAPRGGDPQRLGPVLHLVADRVEGAREVA